MKTFEAVIFDCDGVVVDSDNLQKMAEQQTALDFAVSNGLEFDPDGVDWQEMQGWARRKIAANIFDIAADSELADQYRLAVVEKTAEIATSENTPLIPGIVDFVQYMTVRGLMKGLATSSHRNIYNAYCEVNEMDLFPPQFIVTHGECKDDKPKPGPYLEIMKRMGVNPERTLVIEDSASGIAAGRYAGATVLGLATTKSAEYLRTGTGAHLVATDLKHAAQLIQPYLPN